MLPPTRTRRPAASSIRPTSVVVVDFPFVPVMATMGPRSHRVASSSSPMTGTPAALALSSSGRSIGTPGLSTIKLALSNEAASCSPSSSSMPASRSSASCGIDGLRSVSVTRAPRLASRRAAATPLLAAPTTSTR